MSKKNQENLKAFLQVKNATETSADLYFYGDIVSSWWGAWEDEDQYPDAVKNFLTEHKGKDLNIYMNSGGGSVFAGLAIYNMIKRHEGNKTVYIDGLAASIASVIALAGDKVVMPKAAMFMIHSPWSWGSGNAKDFRKLANDLDEIEKCILAVYEENLKDGVSMDTIKELVDAETWLTAEETQKYFNVEFGEEKQAVACVSEYLDKYVNTPKGLLKSKKIENNEELEEKNKLLVEIDLA
jgi:ATP-dependent Clp endopeptidase proteolytic subunit ClpP